jgi:hypothetical protein
MTIYIDDAIIKLKEIREKEGNLEVCKVGHYGEINELHEISVYRNAGEGTWGEGKKRPVVDLLIPDIGPEPD